MIHANCPFCDRSKLERVHRYDKAPEGETRFSADEHYERCIDRCSSCGHYFSQHRMRPQLNYEGDYVAATYGGSEGMRRTFERIVGLPPESSDNRGRVDRVNAFATAWFGRPVTAGRPLTLLDVGAGLAVFPYAMSRAGWKAVALDPDPGATSHAREVAGLEAIQGDFNRTSVGRRFDVVTFNKVLEHVEQPIAMLRLAHKVLAPGAFVYVELPDGETAATEGFHRAEFFVEHHHIFSAKSMAGLARRAEFNVETIERLREPSGKVTLRMFLSEPGSRTGAK